MLLADVRDIFNALPGDLVDKAQRISSAEMIERLCEIQPRPWVEFGKSGKPITQNKLARLLKPFGISPEQVRFGPDDTRKGYMRHQFDEAFARYLPDFSGSNRNSETNADMTGTSDLFQTETFNPGVSVPKSQKPNNDGQSFGVTVGFGKNSQERAFSHHSPPEVGLSIATFHALINTYDAMAFEAADAAALEGVNKFPQAAGGSRPDGRTSRNRLGLHSAEYEALTGHAADGDSPCACASIRASAAIGSGPNIDSPAASSRSASS
jgi:hypothetical protein